MQSVVHLSLSLAGYAAMAAMALILLVLALHLPQALRADAFPYALQWKRLVPGIVGGALVQRDSLVFAGTTDGRVLAIGRDDGLRRWHRRGFGPVRKGIAVVDGNPAFADAWGAVRWRARVGCVCRGVEGWRGGGKGQGRGGSPMPGALGVLGLRRGHFRQRLDATEPRGRTDDLLDERHDRRAVQQLEHHRVARRLRDLAEEVRLRHEELPGSRIEGVLLLALGFPLGAHGGLRRGRG